MSAVAPVLPGETLGGGKYRVERILGQGGMGIVVAAKHVELVERVAIKFLLGDPGSAALDRFLREARAAVKVKGEHVCRVLDFGRLETGEPYIVMEYLEGTDLSKLVEKSGAQKPSAAVGWIIEACDALVEAHSLGIVHRDVKPANIFLATRGDDTTIAKVLDFGISKLPSQGTQMTGTLTSMGSPAYMSPEQMESARDVDGRTDVWSVGATLYELLAGRPPFVADSMVQLTVMVREKEPPPLTGLPDGLASIVMKCLAKAPADRYPSIRALITDLGPFAPEEALGIVRRHARRDSVPGGAAALAATALETRTDAERMQNARERDPAEGELTESRSDKTGEKGGVGKGTFAPLQSTLDDRASSNEPKRRAWPSLAIGAAVVGGLAALGVMLSKTSATPTSLPTTSAAPEAAVTSAISGDPSAGPSAGATASPSPPAPSIASAIASGKTPTVPTTAVATGPKPTLPPGSSSSKPSVPTVDTSPPTATIATSPASALPPAKPDPKKRRELDRDDP